MNLWDLTNCTRHNKHLYFKLYIKFNIHFILSFKYYVVNAWRWSEWRKYVACVDGDNEICCGGRRYVYQCLIWYTTTGWILQKNDNFKLIYWHSPNYAIVTFPMVRKNLEFFIPRTYDQEHTHKKESNRDPNSNTLEPDRPQHGWSAAFVIAQQYSFANFVSLCFHSGKKKCTARLKNVIIIFLNCISLKLLNFKLLKSGSVCICINTALRTSNLADL